MKKSLAIIAMLILIHLCHAQFTYTTNLDGTLTISDYTGTDATLVIPSNYNGRMVTEISQELFIADTNLTAITFPDSIRYIGMIAFANCVRLTNVVFTSNLTDLRGDAFANCIGLRSVVIPFSVSPTNNFDTAAFGGCTGLTNVTICEGVGSLMSEMFDGCTGLTNIIIPSSLTNLSYAPFYGCTNLKGAFFDGGNIDPDDMTFSSCPVTIYYLPDAAGWETNYSGRPEVVWNPTIQIDAQFGLHGSNFTFNIVGASNLPVAVRSCSDLGQTWISVTNVSLTNGSFRFSDTYSSPAKFYRLSFP